MILSDSKPRAPAAVGSKARDNRRALKFATHAAHERAELQWTEALANSATNDALLIAMQSLHRNHGIAAAKCSGLAGAVALEQQRLTALRHDLSSPQSDAVQDDAGGRPLRRDYALGVLYALNGSAMGAAMMLRPGGIMADRRPAYLELMRAYAQSGALAAFFRHLNAQELSIDLASAGACDVFTAMTQIAVQKKA